MATYVVGDIQGCYTGLKKLLTQINFNPQRDMLWATGDLIGRGSQSLETIQFLYELGAKFNTVLGNHDLHFLAIYHQIRKANRKDKFESLLNSPLVDTYAEWLKQKPLAVKLADNMFLSHAGLFPLWSINEALKFSARVEKYLKNESCKALLEYMYNDDSIAFNEELGEMDTLRFIIDAFTRMRYLCEDEALDFSCKAAVKDAPPHLIPWYEHPNIKNHSKTKVIFGHWASLEGYTPYSHCIALDTGYIWGGKLSLLCLETMEFSSVSQ